MTHDFAARSFELEFRAGDGAMRFAAGTADQGDEFAIAAVLSIIVMYDAMGVRYETGEQAKLLNRMFSEWIDQGAVSLPFLRDKKLKEMVGHTPIEVLTGAVLGVVLGFAMPMA